jgi:hypothetical protein
VNDNIAKSFKLLPRQIAGIQGISVENYNFVHGGSKIRLEKAQTGIKCVLVIAMGQKGIWHGAKRHMAKGIRQKQVKSYKKQVIRALRHFAVVHEIVPVQIFV